MSETNQQYQTGAPITDSACQSRQRALLLLTRLGFEYLPPAQLAEQRQHKDNGFLLEHILLKQMGKLNDIHYKGRRERFSDENLNTALLRLKQTRFDGLQRNNAALFDLLTLGTALAQTVAGDTRSFDLQYIDWQEPQRNCFHVAASVPFSRARSSRHELVDLVLYVNGIPLVVINTGSAEEKIETAINRTLGQQESAAIPGLFGFIQLVLAINQSQARYATTGTPEKFWSRWQELEFDRKQIQTCFETTLDQNLSDNLRANGYTDITMAEANEVISSENITEQDQTLYSLCRPERLLELIYGFTVFENGIKKIARYQQYFVIKSTLRRIQQVDQQGRRKGGMIWHTQGSGKSLTMVMLVRNLLLQQKIVQPRIVLVSDRNDLDRQLANTFAACGLEPQRATSGRHLLELVSEMKAGIITTLIQKFDKAMKIRNFRDDSADIFMLVDESHRSNFGLFAARMRQMFSNACYLGFTGTPLLKKEKNNFKRFGGLIEPHYSIKQAVRDEAVVPLLYEARHVEMQFDHHELDKQFGHYTQGLGREQQHELKRKFASASQLNRSEQLIYMRALDISHHYRSNWQDTGFKAQLVAPDKETALLYHRYLQELAQVSSAVVISPPDEKEGQDSVNNGPAASVIEFWQSMMETYANREEYEKQIINQYRNSDKPEILIVVSKLLTGFDAPRNTVLYLCAGLKEHTLLQAVARVNRLSENKEFGFIVDYVNAMGELDKALNMYSAFDGFDAEDVAGTLDNIQDEIGKLPNQHQILWHRFKDLQEGARDDEWEQQLALEERRMMFYQELRSYGRTLAIALGSEQFLEETNADQLMRYKEDLKRFYQLKLRVRQRYADTHHYRDIEPQIRKMLDIHLHAGSVVQLNPPINIFDEAAFLQVRDEEGVYAGASAASRADAIAHAARKVINDNMQLDPVAYRDFSRMIESTLSKYHQQRISDQEYLNAVVEIRDKLVNHQYQDAPESLQGNEQALPFYGALRSRFDGLIEDETNGEQIIAAAALAIRQILQSHWKVHFWEDDDAQKQVVNEIDDYLYDVVKEQHAIPLTTAEMDDIIELVMQVARQWMY